MLRRRPPSAQKDLSRATHRGSFSASPSAPGSGSRSPRRGSCSSSATSTPSRPSAAPRRRRACSRAPSCASRCRRPTSSARTRPAAPSSIELFADRVLDEGVLLGVARRGRRDRHLQHRPPPDRDAHRRAEHAAEARQGIVRGDVASVQQRKHSYLRPRRGARRHRRRRHPPGLRADRRAANATPAGRRDLRSGSPALRRARADPPPRHARIRRQMEEIQRRALHDALTGLPNRMLFRDRVEQRRSPRARDDGGSAVLLHRPRPLQGGQRHARPRAGDELLQAGRRRGSQAVCAAATRSPASAATSSPSCCPTRRTTHGDARRRRTQLRDALERAVRRSAASRSQVDASVGIARLPGARRRRRRRCCSAPTSRCTRPSSAHAAVARLRPELDDARRRARLDADRRAAPRDRARRARRSTTSRRSTLATGAVVGVEALVRWQPPRARAAPARRFIPLAEQHRADHAAHAVRARRRRCAQCARVADDGHRRSPSPSTSSTRNLLDADLPDDGRARCSTRRASPPARLELEITESDDHGRPGARTATCSTGCASSASRSRSTTSAPATRRSRYLQAAAGRRDQDRPVVRAWTWTSDDERRGDRPLDDRPRPTTSASRSSPRASRRRRRGTRCATLGCDLAQGYLISKPVSAADLAPLLVRVAAA